MPLTAPAPSPAPRARHLATALLAAALAGSCGPGPAADPTPPPPVILIVVDTLRRDHLGCYGYPRPTSPHIDALAADSLRFENGFSPAPWTTPAVGALLTSRYPTTLGIEGDKSILPEEHPTLGEVFSDHGYATGAVVSHTFCSARWNFDQGFDFFDEENIRGHKGITSEGITDRAIEFVERCGDQPFFLWVHYFDPHFDYQLHPEFDLDPGHAYRGPVTPGMKIKQLVDLRREERLGADDIREVLRLYDSEIAYTDHHIGRLLAHLKSRDLYRKAVIAFTADHGEGFLEHDKLGHAKTLYGELIDVPLLLKAPGHRPAVRSAPASLLDLSPTLLEAAELPAAPEFRGSSLLALQDGPDADRRPVFSETSRMQRLRSVIAGGYKLIHDLSEDRYELFHLTADPGEQNPLDLEGPAFESLRRALETWMREVAEGATGAQRELSAEELQHLREIGYGEEQDGEPTDRGGDGSR